MNNTTQGGFVCESASHVGIKSINFATHCVSQVRLVCESRLVSLIVLLGLVSQSLATNAGCNVRVVCVMLYSYERHGNF